MTSDDDRTRLRREPERGSHDPAVIRAIIDLAPICHLGFTDHDGHPVVIPTIHARVGDLLYVHGSVAGRTMRRLAAGLDVCCTITLVDGIVVARSAFWSSMNYRSVMVFGRSRAVTDLAERDLALSAIVDRMIPGRAAEVRPSTDRELRATSVIAIPLDVASAKVRSGDPNDDPADLETEAWAGVVPMSTVIGEAVPTADLAPGIDVPPSVRRAVDRLRT